MWDYDHHGHQADAHEWTIMDIQSEMMSNDPTPPRTIGSQEATSAAKCKFCINNFTSTECHEPPKPIKGNLFKLGSIPVWPQPVQPRSLRFQRRRRLALCVPPLSRSLLSCFLSALRRPRFSLSSAMAASAPTCKREQQPPFYAPRHIYEWKKKADQVWTTKTGLVKYWTSMEQKTNILHCQEFVESMRQRREDEEFPAGVVEGILVQYSSRCLHKFFGWDGHGVTEYTPDCKLPKPDVAQAVQNTPVNKDGVYDVFTLGKVMEEPWFARIRGILSQVFFRNNCNVISPSQLCLLLMADRGEKISWGLLVEENFRVQLRGHRRSREYSSPIGPFLSAYIAKYLAYYRRVNAPPPLGSFIDIQMEMAAQRYPSVPNNGKRPRLELTLGDNSGAGPSNAQGQHHTDVIREHVEHLMLALQAATAEKEALEIRLNEAQDIARRRTQAVQTARAHTHRSVEEARAESRQQLAEAEQTLQNLRNQVHNLELELQTSHDQIDGLTKERDIALERVHRLDQQTQEYQVRCRALTEASEAAAARAADAKATEEHQRLQQGQTSTTAAMENFEANKVGWVQTAARVIAGIAFRKLNASNEEPAEEVINACCDEAIEILELNPSEPEWDDLEGDLADMEILGTAEHTELHIGAQMELHNPTAIEQQIPAPQEPPQDIQVHHDDHEQGRAERVDIPDRLTDVDDTSQPSPRPPADDSVVHEVPPPTPQPSLIQLTQPVPPRPKSFKHHKDALLQMAEDGDWRDEDSGNDSGTDDDAESAISMVIE